MESIAVLTLLWLCGALVALGQNSPSDRIVLPSNSSDAKVTVILPNMSAKDAGVTALPMKDSAGRVLDPQPIIAPSAPVSNTLPLQFSNVYFWGEATLPVQLPSKIIDTFTLQRGPALATPDLSIERTKPASLWLYNFGTSALPARWRIISGTESICGLDSKGTLRSDCNSSASLPEVMLGPLRTDHINVIVPDWWFNPWKAFSDDTRVAELELHFGTTATAPLLRLPIKVHLNDRLSDVPAVWFPWAVAGWDIFQHLFWVTFWVTVGAVCLMLAQVMIPNFRKCLAMENQLESLEERLRGISAEVGDRLCTRCRQELDSIRLGLAMDRSSVESRFRFIDRMALSGNTAEVSRLEGILPRVESRIRLTERLDEHQSAAMDSDLCDLPPSLCWDLDKQIRRVQTILWGQFVTDVDEKNATAILDLLSDPASSLKDFAAALEVRIAGLRRQFANDPCRKKCLDLLGTLNCCTDLLAANPDPVPGGGWTIDELIWRDVCAIRLATVGQMIELDSLLNANPAVRAGVLAKLSSNDAGKLADAANDLLKLSQMVSDADVQTALRNEMWDAYFEPATTTVTDQDVIRVSLAFREKRVNHSAAKNGFQCYWHILPKDKSEQDTYEQGWVAQFISKRGDITVQPEVYDAVGHPVTIRLPAGKAPANPDATEDEVSQPATIPLPQSTDPDKGIFTFTVTQPATNPLHARLLRGMLDAVITAIVPVVTVALTQAQNGGDLKIDQLFLLGFTSQAIRAAVVPDSVTGNPAPQAQSANAAATAARK